MPEPAGTGLPRRSFLLASAGVMLSVYGAGKWGPRGLTEGIAEAATTPPGRILVSVYVAGGWDALSVLAPTGDPLYAAKRPTLALAPDATRSFSEDAQLQWHPSTDGLRTLHGEGKLSVIPGIGYSSPNQSHFTSRHFWEVGEHNEQGRVGWLGRYLDQHGNGTNPLQGLSLSSTLMPTLATGSVPVAAVSQPSSYTFNATGVRSDMTAGMFSSYSSLGQGDGGGALDYARGAVRDSSTLKGQLAAVGAVTLPGGYPNITFSNQLASVASMLSAGLPLECVALQAPGGYDTHNNQATGLASNLANTSNALLAFQRDLEARSLDGRVMTMVWSEFGRRPSENGTTGTDHGAGGLGFLMGTNALGTMIGEFPGLASLDPQGNLKSTTDYRAIYCSLLEQWMGVDATPIIPGAAGFQRPGLLG